VKPHFEEIGPYRFQEFPQKVNVSFHDKNSTVSYRKQSRFNFIPEQSNGKLTDLITNVNVVALAAANQAKSWNILKLKGIEISLAFFGQEIHLTKTAAELLFEGYSDPMIKVAKEIGTIMGVDVPFDRFGWFYGVGFFLHLIYIKHVFDDNDNDFQKCLFFF
jgi:scavenger receptor class B, member 1